jgi:sirohydrochlorin cobaltochelatase
LDVFLCPKEIEILDRYTDKCNNDKSSTLLLTSYLNPNGHSMMSCAYLLVVHGSRDPDYATALADLAARCRQQLIPGSRLGVACLELAAVDLPTQIRQFTAEALAANLHEIKVLPLFLAPGVHSTEDIPQAIESVRSTLSASCQLTLLDAIGHDMLEVLQSIRPQLPSTSILLVHGSRNPGAFLSDLARALELELVAWAIPTPGAQRFTDWVATYPSGQPVGILLYFLFPGKITTAITKSINELRSRFPAVEWQLTDPLAIQNSLVSKIVQRLQA